MDRESRHEIFNRLNYEWKGEPQTCWGPDDNERFRSGVQTNGRVWLGMNRLQVQVEFSKFLLDS